MTTTPISRAIPIVAPSASPAPSGRKTPQSPTKKNEVSTRTLCKNVIIFGSCRNEGKGCIFAHTLQEEQPPIPTFAAPTPTVPVRRVQSPSISTVNVNAPVFVPRGVTAVLSSSTPQLERSIDTPPPDPGPSTTQVADAASYDRYDGGFDGGYASRFSDDFADMQMTDDPSAMLDYGGYAMTPHDPSVYPSPAPMMMGADAYYAPSYPLRPLDYHLYAQAPLPHAATLPENRLFISDTLREDLQKRSETLHAGPPPAGFGLPEEVHTYHSLIPVESASERRKFFAGWTSVVYKAINRKDGAAYALRRIEGFRLLHEAAFGAIEKWSTIVHPNIVQIKEAFTSKAFNDHSLVFAYEYYPNAQTLYSIHLAPKPSTGFPTAPASSPPQSFRQPPKHLNGRGGGGAGAGGGVVLVPERTMWSYVIQIANAIKAVHDQGMAVRILDVTKILVVGKNRIRINCCGVFDVVAYNPTLSVELMQQEDLIALGKIIYILGCGSSNAVNAVPKAIEMLMRTYSPDLNNLAYFLISKPTQRKTIDEVLTKLGPKLLTEMNAIQSYADDLEGELMGELENARLVRLLCKFGFINERPDFTHELRWSETGDRYIIKLFRDYVFHQVDEMGNAVTNMGHVLTCLNKLDAGTDERIMLMSRDEQSCLVVSYKEIKSCIEQAFSELSRPQR